jgi:hypothetical protein
MQPYHVPIVNHDDRDMVYFVNQRETGFVFRQI